MENQCSENRLQQKGEYHIIHGPRQKQMRGRKKILNESNKKFENKFEK